MHAQMRLTISVLVALVSTLQSAPFSNTVLPIEENTSGKHTTPPAVYSIDE